MTIPPNVKFASLFLELQKEAREAKRGLWGE
jgi:micrococcal nuclease